MIKNYILFLLILLTDYSFAMESEIEKDKRPTIQEAWVNTGYFIWVDSTKTSLRITDLGAKQEILSDVSDGEQLRKADHMFEGSGDNYHIALKVAPFFNTVNISDFYRMFSGCTSLISVPLLDTSNGRDFSFMFENCTLLKDIPSFNTSNGKNFAAMFIYCTSLEICPLLDTSNGLHFIEMFSDCTSLFHVPFLDTSNGKQFSAMFKNCISLKTKPQLNMRNAKDWSYMFKGTRFDESIY